MIYGQCNVSAALNIDQARSGSLHEQRPETRSNPRTSGATVAEKEQSKKWPVAVKEVDQWRKETLATIGEYTEHPPETADFLFERTLKDFEQIEESSKLVTTRLRSYSS